MRVTKKNQQQNGHREIVDAVKALCAEKDIEPEILFNAIEEAMKAAYRKNVSREENAPSNLSVTMDRNTGDVHVFARKTITDELEDPANQITLEEAQKIRPDYRMGDIAEIDVTPKGFLRTAAQTASVQTAISVSYIWVETVCYIIGAVILILFWTVEKNLPEEQKAIKERSKK